MSDIRKELPGTFAGCVGGLRLRLVTEDELMAALAQPQAAQPEAVAIVAEVHMSRYTIEWTNGPLPEGTKLYATPPNEPATQSGRASRKAR